MYYSKSNVIKNCTIERIVYKTSKNNTFEGNIIPEKQITKLNKSKVRKFLEKWVIEFAIIAMMIIFIPIILFLDYFINTFPMLINITVSIFSIFLIVITLSHFLNYKKSMRDECTRKRRC
jgi:amino acid transporter